MSEATLETVVRSSRPSKGIFVILAVLLVFVGATVLWWGAPEAAVIVAFAVAYGYAIFHLVVYAVRRATGSVCRVPDTEDVEDGILSIVPPFVLSLLPLLWHFLR